MSSLISNNIIISRTRAIILLAPKSLWPKYNWLDISGQYSGLFFRVLGGKAAPFLKIQEESSPRFNGFKSYGIHGVAHEELKEHEMKTDGKWSDDKSSVNVNGFPVSFRVGSDEVRPRNTAVRVWKRI